jgi:hypothetical protein
MIRMQGFSGFWNTTSSNSFCRSKIESRLLFLRASGEIFLVGICVQKMSLLFMWGGDFGRLPSVLLFCS